VQADAVAAALAQAHRSERAFVLSATVRVASDLDVAEECAQEAYVSALQAWTRDGVPERPGAWLTTAARNKALDRLRRDVTLWRKLPRSWSRRPSTGTTTPPSGLRTRPRTRERREVCAGCRFGAMLCDVEVRGRRDWPATFDRSLT
jgi:DNA-directed RNA polymerase specialized sigma24 family protein